MSVASPHTFALASYDWCATNSAPSRSRSSASSEASNLLSSHGMISTVIIRKQYAWATTSFVSSATLCSTLWFAMRAPAALRCVTNHRPSRLRFGMWCTKSVVSFACSKTASKRQSLRTRHQQTQIPSRPVPGAPSAKDSHNRAPSANYSR